MAGNIKITPDQLNAQATQMSTLASRYDTLFKNVNSTMKNVNANWSANLSHNFSGKINSSIRSFSNVVSSLNHGATAAGNSARTMEGIDKSLAKAMGGGKSTSTKSKAVTKKKKKKGTFKYESLDQLYGKVVKKAKKTIKSITKSYKNKGIAYKVIEYGKACFKITSATVKCVGGVLAIVGTGGVATPIAILGIISGLNDVNSAASDFGYLLAGNYDSVGTTNWLKDNLVNGYGMLGEILGSQKVGEYIGRCVYNAIDIVSFLSGADKMLKGFGKINTLVTDTAGFSFIWGKTTFDDIIDDQNLVKHIIKTGINVVKTYKKGVKLVTEILPSFYTV